jgi:hypothetical protein
LAILTGSLWCHWCSPKFWIILVYQLVTGKFIDCLPYFWLLTSSGISRHQRGQIGHKFDLGAVVTWIVASLGGGSNCQDHLDALFKAINSYYHPSNVGTWHTKLNDFLRRLPAAFVKRLHRERSNKKSWLTPTPENAKLTETDITRFVESNQWVHMRYFCPIFSIYM